MAARDIFGVQSYIVRCGVILYWGRPDGQDDPYNFVLLRQQGTDVEMIQFGEPCEAVLDEACEVGYAMKKHASDIEEGMRARLVSAINDKRRRVLTVNG